MCVKSDEWIKKMAIEFKMIEPFQEELISKNVMSYGVSSYGYDLRLDDKILRMKKVTKIDPKNVNRNDYIEEISKEILINSGEVVVGKSIEYFKIPRDVIGLCFGKSSYARLGILINITPLEPEWEGYITISIYNANKADVIIYSGEGIAQVIFVSAEEECRISYKDRKGKYQAQKGIEITKV